MTNQITARLWRRKDSDASGTWERVGTMVTAEWSMLRTIAHRYRTSHFSELGEWWEYAFFAVPKPIRSRENPILVEFREHLESIIDPHSPREATWWLQLLEWDPFMENENHWGEYLPGSIEDRHIEQAKRVLTRLRDSAKE